MCMHAFLGPITAGLGDQGGCSRLSRASGSEHSFIIHSLNTHVLSRYCVLSPVLGPGDLAVNKTKTQTLLNFCLAVETRKISELNK